jgi:Na+-transporting methylmalonyl-CoA/oxaloacetate decarboxylase gamma subunit
MSDDIDNIDDEEELNAPDASTMLAMMGMGVVFLIGLLISMSREERKAIEKIAEKPKEKETNDDAGVRSESPST